MAHFDLTRITSTGYQTQGRFHVYPTQDATTPLFSCVSLEPPWKENKVAESSIPPRTYIVVKRYTEEYGWHFHVKEVEGRTWILIHVLNYSRDSLGCIGVGKSFYHLDADEHLDITYSRETLDKILELADEENTLTITGY